MKIKPPLLVFLVIEILVVLLILSTASELPATVATHFNAAGIPNNSMSKSDYLAFILAFSVLMPAFVVGSLFLVLRITPQRSINIPNRAFWLAPANRQETIRYVNNHLPWLGSLMCSFMGYVYWVIVLANRVQPAQFPGQLMFVGVGCLLAGLLLWSAMLLMKFSRIPKA